MQTISDRHSGNTISLLAEQNRQLPRVSSSKSTRYGDTLRVILGLDNNSTGIGWRVYLKWLYILLLQFMSYNWVLRHKGVFFFWDTKTGYLWGAHAGLTTPGFSITTLKTDQCGKMCFLKPHRTGLLSILWSYFERHDKPLAGYCEYFW